jgi:ABC-type transporter Mla MlaB component
MALQILEQNGTFELHGSLTNTTVRSFIIHFEHIIQTVKKVVVDIDKLKHMDASGIEGLKTVRAIALREHKILSIVGYRNQAVDKDYKGAFAA